MYANRSTRFPKDEMRIFMKYKNFLLDNIDHIKETNKIFNAITAKCTVNRSILFREREFPRNSLKKDVDTS